MITDKIRYRFPKLKLAILGSLGVLLILFSVYVQCLTMIAVQENIAKTASGFRVKKKLENIFFVQ